jgi:hypothetical protein
VKFRTPRTLRATLEEIARIRRDPQLSLWSLVVLLVPFYIFPSGVPQPADLLAFALLPMLWRGWNGRLPPAVIKPLKYLLLFMIYVVIVNVVWSFAIATFSTDAKQGFLLAPTYYLFNGLMFFTFLLMFQRYGERLLWLTVRLVLASVLLQAAIALALPKSLARATVMFNNANQLGYYAVLSACIILLGQKRLKLSTLQVTIGLAAASYLALLSASKAALASICALGIALMISKVRTIALTLVVLALLITTDNPFSRAIDRAQQRIEHDQSYGFIQERGYDRIGEYPEYWIMGAGEGYYDRFRETSAIGSHELHSSMATLFFCYGVFGTLLFLLYLWGTMRGAGIRAWLILGAALAYGMTHQGLRFRLMWLLLAMVAALRELDTRERLARRAAQLAQRALGRPRPAGAADPAPSSVAATSGAS